MPPFDALAAATALETAGFTPDRARAVAVQLQAAAEAGREGPATKVDLEAVKADLRTEIASFKVWTMTWTAAVGGVVVATVKLIP